MPAPAPTESDPKALVARRLGQHAATHASSIANELDRARAIERRLQEGQVWLQRSTAALALDKQRLEDALLALRQKDDDITKWLSLHEDAAPDSDTSFVPADPLSEQYVVVRNTTLQLIKSIEGNTA